MRTGIIVLGAMVAAFSAAEGMRQHDWMGLPFFLVGTALFIWGLTSKSFK